MEHEIRRLRIDMDNLESVYSSMDYESYYLLTDNNTDVPSKDDGGWSTTFPTIVKGKYLWVMNIIDTGVAKLKTEPFCTNVGGEETINDMDIEFIQTNSRINPPSQSDTGWSTDAPTHLIGKYIWSRTKISSTYGLKYSEPVCITGDSGVETSQGLLCGTQDNSPLYMHIRYCTLNNPSDIAQTSLQPQKYIGYYVDDTVTDSTDVSKYSWKLRPDDGLSYSLNNVTYYMHIKYAYDNIGTGLNETGGSFIGYYYDTSSADSSDVSKYFFFKIESKGILVINEEYAISNDYINIPSAGWSTSKPVTTDTAPYLWSRNLIRYTDNSTQAVGAVCLSALDGEDVHYIFYRTTDDICPDTPTKSTTIITGGGDDITKWYEDPQGVSAENICEWVSKQLRINGVWTDYSTPSLWAKYAGNGDNGYVHIAYSTSEDGYENFTTGDPDYTPLYMGTYTSNDPNPPKNHKLYVWTKIKGEDGQNGQTPSTDTIKEIVQNTEINASTLNGNTEDSFIPSVIPTKTIYRDDSETSENYVKFYQIGQIVICQVCKFWGNADTNYGVDPKNSSYFLLMDKTIPEEWRPQTTMYTNDLNSDDATSKGVTNGRVKISEYGYVSKLGTAGSKYINTYATFIYPIIPKTDIMVDYGASSSTIYYASQISATVSTTGGDKVSGVPVTFTFTKGSAKYEFVGYSDSDGKAVVSVTAPVADSYALAVQCKGNGLYNPSEVESSTENIKKTPTTLTGDVSGTTLTYTFVNGVGNPISGASLNFYGQFKYTDSNGQCTFTVTRDGEYEASIDETSNYYGASADITVSGLSPTYSEQVKVPTVSYNVETSSANKAWANATDVSKVQVKEDTSQSGYALYVQVNGNNYQLNVTPAPLVFSGFNFSNYGEPKKVYVTVRYGVFTYNYAITNLSMQPPDVYLIIGSTTMGGKEYTGNENISSADGYHSVTFELTNLSAALLSSSDLIVKVVPKRNYCTTKGTYNVVEFKLDYVEIKAEY